MFLATEYEFLHKFRVLDSTFLDLFQEEAVELQTNFDLVHAAPDYQMFVAGSSLTTFR